MTLLEQLQQAPDAVLIVEKFQSWLKTEADRRAEFLAMIHENIKAEFINGQIVIHSPATMAQLRVCSRLSTFLANHVLGHDLGFVGIEKMMIALSRNCYEPDIVFFRKQTAQSFTDEQKLFPVPDLVVEILSDSTRHNDYGIKFQDYAAHGVGEYWIVDAEAETLEQLVLIGEELELQGRFEKTGTLTSIVIHRLSLDLSKVFV